MLLFFIAHVQYCVMGAMSMYLAVFYTSLRSDTQNYNTLDQLHDFIFLLQCCPGYVDTDMSSHKGTKTIDEGKKLTSLLPSK